MKRNSIIAIALLAIFVALFVLKGCEPTPAPPKPNPHSRGIAEVKAPTFNGDSSFAFVAKQVAFGPRVPNSIAHDHCGDWLVEKLKQYEANVVEQNSVVEAWDGSKFRMRNIIGEINPSAKKRVMLAAHWDTRPYADKDSLESNWKKPIDGANDGASGVGVLLEIARMLHEQPASIGIDVVFFDIEDCGTPEWAPESDNDQYTWCLGSQYWAENPHRSGYQALFGVLLDMVGAPDAKFNREGQSMAVAQDIVSKIWKTAQALQFGEYFQDYLSGGITDDHVFMNDGGVRTVDIIDMRSVNLPNGYSGFQFGSYHHTMKDNLENIDRNTLKAVGQSLCEVLYNTN